MARFRRVLVLALFGISSVVSGPASSQDEGSLDLSGTWDFDVLTSPNGPGQREALFRQEGQRVIGFIESNSARGGFVGTFDGKNLAFTSVLDFGGLPVAGDYTATVEGDTMEGQIDYGEYGVATFIGRRRLAETAAMIEEAPVDEIFGSALDADIDAARIGPYFGVTVKDTLIPELVSIEGGAFNMGRNDEFAWESERFVHEVEVSDYAIGRFPVTNEQFLVFARATGHPMPMEPKGWTGYFSKYPNHPVVNVSWNDAEAYVQWLSALTGDSYRLPTEAEWEYAALAGHDGRIYVWGDDWRNDASNTSSWRAKKTLDRESWKVWWDAEGERLSTSEVMTTRVGSFPPNDWGLYDMSGNVWEWMHDWFDKDYYRTSPKKDPMGPPDGAEKVLRGASWYNKPDVSAIAVRDRYEPTLQLNYNGFRVVRVEVDRSNED